MVNIISYNVNGLGNVKKRSKVYNFLHKKPYDIICLQEVHCSKNTEKLFKSHWGGQFISARGTSNARGCAILVRKKLKTKISHVKKDPNGCYIVIDMKVKNYRFLLCNIYAPNEDKIEFFQNTFQVVEEMEQITGCHEIVIAGDFNTSFGQLDKVSVKGVSPGHPKVVNFLIEYFSQKNIFDIWRLRHPKEKRLTFFRTKPYKLMERLDFIFVSASLTNLIVLSEIEPSFMSDHAMPMICFYNGEIQDKGPGYWKLNTMWYDNPEFQQIVQEQIKKCNELYQDPIERLEMIKMFVHGEAIKFGARKKKTNNLLEVLECKLYRLSKERDSGSTLFTDVEEQIILVQKDIEEIVQERTIACQNTNQTNWHLYGEKMSKYFLI